MTYFRPTYFRFTYGGERGRPVINSGDLYSILLFIGGSNYGKGTAIYKFEKIKRAKRKALADHPNRQLLDFGIGENDSMAPQSVRDAMVAEVNRPENRGYADNGIVEFKEGIIKNGSRPADTKTPGQR